MTLLTSYPASFFLKITGFYCCSFLFSGFFFCVDVAFYFKKHKQGLVKIFINATGSYRPMLYSKGLFTINHNGSLPNLGIQHRVAHS